MGCVHSPIVVEPKLLLVHPRSATTCVPSHVTQHKLQNNLQLESTCAGLGGARQGQAVNQGQLLLVPGLGQLSERHGAHWSHMLLVWHNSENLKHGLRQAIHTEKPLETAQVVLKFGWGKAWGNHQGGTNSVSQVDGVTDIVPSCQLCGSVRGRLPRRGTVASASTSVQKKAAFQLSHWCYAVQFVHILWCLSICCPHAGALREYVWVSLCLSCLRVSARESSSFCLLKPQSPLVFTARSYGDFSSWHWNPGLGVLVWCWDPSLLKYPSRFLSTTHGCGSSPFHISTPPASHVVVSFLIP